jgi:hypothetical protein
MTESIHPAASDRLPSFITAPGETDVLMVAMAVVLLLFVLMVGILYFRLHALPERFAHKVSGDRSSTTLGAASTPDALTVTRLSGAGQ